MDLNANKIDGTELPITTKRISASEWNQLVSSCMAFIYSAGLTPDANDSQQFLNAFKIIASNLEIVGANTSLSNLTSDGEAHFANPSLSNLNQSGRDNIISWVKSSISGSSNPLSPNYSRASGRSWGQTYTANEQGYVLLSVTTQNSRAYLTVGGIAFMLGGFDDNDGGGDSIMMPVGIGTSYVATGSVQSISNYVFIPIQG